MKQITLTNTQELVCVDDGMYEYLAQWKWCSNIATNDVYKCGGYAQSTKGNFAMHRLVMGLEKGDGKQVDHINGNKLDNRRANLRLCTVSENALNRKYHRNKNK